MKYFAKYLPEEGEIREGDLFINPLTDIVKSASKSDLEGIINCNNTGCRKVKMHLCSRDIEVGDEIWTGLGKNKLVIEDGSEGREGGFWTHKSAVTKYDFKDIGEVSPEARWVVEGDEFTEYDLRRMAIISGSFPMVRLPWIEGRERLGYKMIIELRGPCDHFH